MSKKVDKIIEFGTNLIFISENERTSSYCMEYSISTSLNILYNTNTTGQDVVVSFTYSDIPQPSFARYSWGLFGEAVLPNQGKRIVDELSGLILGQSDHLPTAETTNLTFEEMIEIIEDPNRMAVFVFNTDKGKWKSGHAMLLAAYDPNKDKFGFLNSGWGSKYDELTWYAKDELKGYMEDPIGLWNPHFLVISDYPQSR